MPDPAKRKRSGEQKVLDYHDVLLREQDVSLLEGAHWLNDQVVAFWFEYLGREGLQQVPTEEAPPTQGSRETSPQPAAAASAASSMSQQAQSQPELQSPQQQPQQQQSQPLRTEESLLLLPPSTSFLLMYSSPQMSAEVLAPLKPNEKGLVLFAVNDNTDVDVAAGGSHWSLLAYHRPSNTLRHYDSSPSFSDAKSARCSSRAARKLAAAVGPALVGGEGAGSGPGSSGGRGAAATSPPRLVEVSCMPRQVNGYDCGVYVLAVARALCGWWLRGVGAGGPAGESSQAAAQRRAEAEWEAMEQDLRRWLTPVYVEGLRTEVLELIRAKATTGGVGPGPGVGAGV